MITGMNTIIATGMEPPDMAKINKPTKREIQNTFRRFRYPSHTDFFESLMQLGFQSYRLLAGLFLADAISTISRCSTSR